MFVFPLMCPEALPAGFASCFRYLLSREESNLFFDRNIERHTIFHLIKLGVVLVCWMRTPDRQQRGRERRIKAARASSLEGTLAGTFELRF